MDITTLLPEDTPEYMLPAWLGCVSWASKKQEILDAFLDDTGVRITPPRHGIEAMIDEATGRDDDVIRLFVEWVNKNIWGSMSDETLDDA